MEVFVVIIFIGLVILMTFVQHSNQEDKINRKVEELGGRVLSMERTMFNNGPFFIKGKGRTIYRFEYQIGDNVHEGWVKFGSLFGPDWRM